MKKIRGERVSGGAIGKKSREVLSIFVEHHNCVHNFWYIKEEMARIDRATVVFPKPQKVPRGCGDKTHGFPPFLLEDTERDFFDIIPR